MESMLATVKPEDWIDQFFTLNTVYGRTVERERSAKFDDVVLSLALRCAVDGDLTNALLATLGNEEHVIYRLTRVSSSKVLAPEIEVLDCGVESVGLGLFPPRPTPPAELGRLALGLDIPLLEELASITGSLWRFWRLNFFFQIIVVLGQS